MGTAEFGIPTLKILNDVFNLDTIVTNYDKPSGRGQKIRFSAVKEYAITNNVNLLQPKNLKDEGFVKKIQKINPDFIVVVAFRMIHFFIRLQNQKYIDIIPRTLVFILSLIFLTIGWISLLINSFVI